MPDLVATLIDKLEPKPDNVIRIGSIATDGTGQYLALDSALIRSYLRVSSYTPTNGDVVLCARLIAGVVVLGKIVPVP